MWRHTNRLISLLIVFFISWYVLETSLIQNYLIPKATEYLTTAESSDAPAKHSFIIRNPIEEPAEINATLIADTIFQLTNELRQEQGVGQLARNDALTQVAKIRAMETETNFSHTRPDDSPFHTVLESVYNYQMAGENLAMGTYHGSNTEMAAFLFDGWVESQGHYENMIEPGFTEIGIGVHYDGEMLYLVQIFGTPL